MEINVGGLWDKPIPMYDEMTYAPSIYSDDVCAEIIPSYNIQDYQSLADYISFKSFSPLTTLDSDTQFSLRGCDLTEEIYAKEPQKRCSGKSSDNLSSFTIEWGGEKCNVRAVNVEMSENISGGCAAKALRVRSSAAKDRHGKVSTAKGLRDTRVRLSHSTALKFYDVQFRLGFDRPSKALDWLISNAQDAIDELPETSSLRKSISKSGTSLATDHFVSTYSQTKHGCPEHTTDSTKTNTCRSGADRKRECVRNVGEAKEQHLRSCRLTKVGIP